MNEDGIKLYETEAQGFTSLQFPIPKPTWRIDVTRAGVRFLLSIPIGYPIWHEPVKIEMRGNPSWLYRVFTRIVLGFKWTRIDQP